MAHLSHAQEAYGYSDFIPDKDLWKTKMDPAQIEQILMNLAVNTRDAINSVGKISIETRNAVFDTAYCKHHEGSREGEYVMMACSDSGTDMDKKRWNIFSNLFFATKKEGKGTGLGLSAVFCIVKQNNGFINVYSEPGMGTTFKIYLPCNESADDDSVQTPGRQILTGTETVLIVRINLKFCRWPG